MWQADRQAMQQVYIQSWQKHQRNAPLSDLERQIVALIQAHPEYQRTIESLLDSDAQPWFGHLSAHLALQEQLNTNRPEGIQKIFGQLCHEQGSAHEAQHLMMACLIEHLPLLQKTPLEAQHIYLDRLKQLIQHPQDHA